MSLSKHAYRGTRDFFPKDKRVLDYLFGVMRKTAESFGYESYDGPLLEEVELYLAKSGEELINEQIYSFKDRGDRFVAIRPEMTPTLARMVSQVHRELPKPLRWYAIPNLMRYEKPQKGRLREHWQFNCDIFGADKVLGTVEIMQVAINLLKNFGATGDMFEILINDRQVIDAIFGQLLALSKDQSYRLYKIIDKAKKVTPEALDKMISEVIPENNKKEIFKNYLSIANFEELFAFLSKHQLDSSVEDFKNFVAKLKNFKLDSYIKYDPSIVRGLDYYTGVVFEIFDKSPDNRRAICGGGAYANLLQIFNEEPVPGVGFGLGDVTLADFLVTHKLMPDLSLAHVDLLIGYMDNSAESTAMQIADQARQFGLKAEVVLGAEKPKKVFQLAEKKGHRFAILLGETEIKSGEFEVKNLATRESHKFSLKNLDHLKSLI